MWLKVRVACLMLVALAAIGCPSTPVLQLHGGQIRGANAAGVTLNLVVRVNNKNSYDVKARNVRMGVTIADRFRLPAVYYNSDQWMPAGRSILMDVPVTLPWSMVAPLLTQSVGSHTVHYRMTGYVDVTAVRMLGLQVNDYKVDETGSISRSALVMAAGRSVIPGGLGR